MRNLKYNILTLVGLLLLIGLFSFCNYRNNQRKTSTDKVIFTSSNNLLISEEMVNKLLIQKTILSKIPTKETLALDSIEFNIKAVPHIKEAQAYVSVNGLVSASITPRKAIGRLYSSKPSYIDKEGFKMPLVRRYSERVPLVFYFKEEYKTDLVFLLQKIDGNSFLKKLVVGVYCKANGHFLIKIRHYEGNIELGTIENIDSKIKNLKAFYAKAIKDQLFEKYKKINLEITHQVVCTK